MPPPPPLDFPAHDPTAHPLVRAMLLDRAHPALTDWLVENDVASPAAMALLLAGTPPWHTDGLPRRYLATWLEGVGREVDADRVRRMDLGGYLLPGQVGQGEMVLVRQFAGSRHFTELPLTRFSTGGLRAVVREMLVAWPEPTRWGHFPEIDRAGRWLVREVLRLPLFSGLTFARRCEISREHAMYMPSGMTLEKVLASFRIHPGRSYDLSSGEDGGHVYTQKLTAPDLVWVDDPNK